MNKSFYWILFNLFSFAAFTQITTYFNYEQAYGMSGKDKGSLYSIEETVLNNAEAAAGEFNGFAVMAKLEKNAEATKWKSFKTLIPGSQSVFLEIQSYVNLTGPKFITAGMCTDCVAGRKGQVAFIMFVDLDFNPVVIAGKTIHYFYPVVDSFQVRNQVKIILSSTTIYLAYEGDSGFGSDVYMHAINTTDMSQQWRKQINTNFFEQPVLLNIESPDIISLGLNGWGKSRLLKIATKDGAIRRQFDFTDSPAQFAALGAGNYAMAYLTNDTMRVSRIDTAGKEVYKNSIKLNTNLVPQFAIVSKRSVSVVSNTILLATAFNDISEWPYNRSNTRVYAFLSNNASAPIQEYIIPENGTTARNIKQITGTTTGKFSMVGDRDEGNTNRPFYFIRHDLPLKPTAPTTWYGPLCSDTSLIEKNSVKTYPNTLPKIENNVVYATKTNFQNKQVNVWMDIYRPYDHYAMDSKDKRPAYIYFHGGGYVFGGEDGGSELIRAAERGMIGIGVKYRLGRLPNSIPNADSLQSAITNSIQNTYRALQDARDAVKYIVDNADKYNIDKDKLFIAGFSAGGNIVLNYDYLETKNFEASIINGLGPLTAKTPVAGILSGAGPFNQLVLQGLASPLDYIDKSENTPLYMVHGTCDSTALYNYGNLFDPTTKGSVGSYAIACRKQSLGHPYHFTTVKGGDHNLGSNADKIYESIFKWIKNEVICGKIINGCELFIETNAKGACVNVPTCPACTATPFVHLESTLLRAYPNPANQYVELNIDNVYNTDLKVFITDVNGKINLSQIVRLNNNRFRINTSSLLSGVYFITVYTKNALYSGRFIKI